MSQAQAAPWGSIPPASRTPIRFSAPARALSVAGGPTGSAPASPGYVSKVLRKLPSRAWTCSRQCSGSGSASGRVPAAAAVEHRPEQLLAVGMLIGMGAGMAAGGRLGRRLLHLGVAVLGTIFFGAFGDPLPSYAPAIVAWACLVPLAAAFGLIFLLPMRARGQE